MSREIAGLLVEHKEQIKFINSLQVPDNIKLVMLHSANKIVQNTLERLEMQYYRKFYFSDCVGKEFSTEETITDVKYNSQYFELL